MGFMIDGQWYDKESQVNKDKGEFKRQPSTFRNWITKDGQAGLTGQGDFKAESGRYHLYFSYACPWACRALIFLHLKDLMDHISLSPVHPHLLDKGWTFQAPFEDPIFNTSYLYEIYQKADPKYSGRITVPILWDKQKKTIVNNESAEIIRMLNSEFNHLTNNQLDFYPEPLRDKIDTINDFVYKNINNGVYRCGFAKTQTAYNDAVGALFQSLDNIEKRLSKQAFLVENTLTEADWRLFTTLIRFDIVYHGHFKCNLKLIKDYPNLNAYLKRLYHHPGIESTIKMDQIKEHYYYSHKHINPSQIIPQGPVEIFR